mmetsp:Transcript_27646/g.36915  ORF Transcript_27646/g.36915 Transcript_27646/m.36915 type:complete len:87 (+) Transcript_27646:250-510(+)
MQTFSGDLLKIDHSCMERFRVKGNLKITRELLAHLELWHLHTIFEFEKLSFRSKDSEIGHIMTRMLELLNLSIKCETFSLDSIMEY